MEIGKNKDSDYESAILYTSDTQSKMDDLYKKYVAAFYANPHVMCVYSEIKCLDNISKD